MTLESGPCAMHRNQPPRPPGPPSQTHHPRPYLPPHIQAPKATIYIHCDMSPRGGALSRLLYQTHVPLAAPPVAAAVQQREVHAARHLQHHARDQPRQPHDRRVRRRVRQVHLPYHHDVQQGAVHGVLRHAAPRADLVVVVAAGDGGGAGARRTLANRHKASTNALKARTGSSYRYAGCAATAAETTLCLCAATRNLETLKK